MRLFPLGILVLCLGASARAGTRFEVDPGPYGPGSPIHVKVFIDPGDDPKVRTIRAVLTVRDAGLLGEILGAVPREMEVSKVYLVKSGDHYEGTLITPAKSINPVPVLSVEISEKEGARQTFVAGETSGFPKVRFEGIPRVTEAPRIRNLKQTPDGSKGAWIEFDKTEDPLESVSGYPFPCTRASSDWPELTGSSRCWLTP